MKNHSKAFITTTVSHRRYCATGAHGSPACEEVVACGRRFMIRSNRPSRRMSCVIWSPGLRVCDLYFFIFSITEAAHDAERQQQSSASSIHIIISHAHNYRPRLRSADAQAAISSHLRRFLSFGAAQPRVLFVLSAFLSHLTSTTYYLLDPLLSVVTVPQSLVVGLAAFSKQHLSERQQQ